MISEAEQRKTQVAQYADRGAKFAMDFPRLNASDGVGKALVRERWEGALVDKQACATAFAKAFNAISKQMREAMDSGRYEFHKTVADTLYNNRIALGEWKGNLDYEYRIFDMTENAYIGHWDSKNMGKGWRLYDRARKRVDLPDGKYRTRAIECRVKTDFLAYTVRYRGAIRSVAQIEKDKIATERKKAEALAAERAADSLRSKEKRAEALYEALKALRNVWPRSDRHANELQNARALIAEIDAEIAKQSQRESEGNP